MLCTSESAVISYVWETSQVDSIHCTGDKTSFCAHPSQHLKSSVSCNTILGHLRMEDIASCGTRTSCCAHPSQRFKSSVPATQLHRKHSPPQTEFGVAICVCQEGRVVGRRGGLDHDCIARRILPAEMLRLRGLARRRLHTHVYYYV